jgi:hypothetical protein
MDAMPSAAPWIVIGALVAVVALVLIVAFRYDASRREAFRAAWRGFASSRGFQWTAASGPWYRKPSDAIDGSTQGVPFRLDTYTVSTGKSQIVYTRAAGSLARPIEAKLVVSRRTFFTGIGERFGRRSIPTGDRSFDEKWALRSKAPDAARRLVDETVRARVRALDRRAILQVEGKEARVWWNGRETDPSVLDAACDLVAAVVRGSANA